MSELGLLMTVGSVGWALFEPIFGVLADKIGKRNLMIYSIVVTSLIYFSYTLANSVWDFALIIFALSCNSAAATVSFRAMTAELLPTSGRGKTYGRYMALLSIGQMVGPLIGGFLADRVGKMIPFYLSGGIGVIGFLAVMLIRSDERHADGPSLPVMRLNKNAMMSKTFLGILTVRMVYMFNMSFGQNILPVFLHEHMAIKATETEIGIYMGIVRFTSGVSQLFLGNLSDRFGMRGIMIFGLAFAGCSYLTLIGIDSVVSVYLLGAFQGVFFASGDLTMMLRLMMITPNGSGGKAMGLYGFSEDIGGIVSSPLLGAVYDELGPLSSIYTISVILIGDAILSGFVFERKKAVNEP